jgi:hypothetical protein
MGIFDYEITLLLKPDIGVSAPVWRRGLEEAIQRLKREFRA